MVENTKIINEYKKLLKDIKKHNKFYFAFDDPKITDSEYDNLKKKVKDLERKYSFLKKYGSIDQLIGTEPLNKFKKIKHLRPMLSLSNAFNIEDMKDFVKKINNFLNLDKRILNF